MYLPAGEYFYKFVVDGNWVIDRNLPIRRDDKGQENNVLRVDGYGSGNQMSNSMHSMQGGNNTEFRWSNGGSRVFVTGSFNQWQDKLELFRK